MKEQIITQLKGLTEKKNVVLTRRGNLAIKHALDIAKAKGYITLLLPDQGVWMTWKDFAEKKKMRIIEIKTDDGIIDLNDLKEYQNCALAVQTYAGYFARQDMEELRNICNENKLLMIEDATPALGDFLYGDIVLASFGPAKPVNLGTGGMIAFDYDIAIAESFEGDYAQLLEKLKALPLRMEMLKRTAKLIKSDLSEFKIIHRDRMGINVAIAYETEEEKNAITNYCNKMHYEFTECPRYIRVNRKAISIEVKRLE